MDPNSFLKAETAYLESIEAKLQWHQLEIERLKKLRDMILSKHPEAPDPKKITAPAVVEKKLDTYPFSGDKQAKILAVLRMNGRVMRQPEIEAKIRDIEGVEAEKTLVSFYHELNNKMLNKEGNIAFVRVAGSYKFAFYALPEWLNKERRLIPDYQPAESSWGGFPLNKRKKITSEKWILKK